MTHAAHSTPGAQHARLGTSAGATGRYTFRVYVIDFAKEQVYCLGAKNGLKLVCPDHSA